ncbi:MAG TPA: ATP-binding cassette domain-containing protein [Gemmatimonadaceae bacterium]|nr:ATP-binding cassette domain-containing protein [Gemmatimonadaceae bacterium]
MRVSPLNVHSVMAAIETHALRKVYPAPPAPKRRRRAGASGAPAGQGGPSFGANGGSASQVGAAGNPRGEIVALKALDLEIRDGEFFGLLGPNGAGKTTTIGILTTRVRPTSGKALIGGADVATQAVQVRQRIGVVPQRPNPDRSLNVIENLLFHAAYFGIPTSKSRPRALALLEQLGIADKASAKVDEMSGGQQQRLMIARALIHEPQVIFLDEPTVGLDPQTRLALWDILRELHAERRTIVMTTHYMDEADKLCDRIAIVDRGELLELDTPAALKERAPGGTMIEIALSGDAVQLDPIRAEPGVLRAESAGSVLRVYSDRGGRVISPVIQLVEDQGLHVANISLTEPSLETLFVARTGRKLD